MIILGLFFTTVSIYYEWRLSMIRDSDRQTQRLVERTTYRCVSDGDSVYLLEGPKLYVTFSR